jgi:hypothetical protein
MLALILTLAADAAINREKPRRVVNLSQQEAVEKTI